MKDTKQIEQRTPEWKALRNGKYWFMLCKKGNKFIEEMN